MKRIAVTYENGQIFQHFGHTEQFKIYEIENGSIVNEKIVDTNGSGHGALADLLKSEDVDILICGGIGGGGGAPMGGGFGDELGDLGEPGSDETTDIGGDEGSADLSSMGGDDAGESTPLNESVIRTVNEDCLNRIKALPSKDFYKEYLKKLGALDETAHTHVAITDKGLMINETIDSTIKELDDLVVEHEKNIITEEKK